MRSVTQDIWDSMLLDVWPRMAAVVDFGLDTQEHYNAFHEVVRQRLATIEELDEALGSGPALTKLARRGRNKSIVFKTAYDDMPTEEGD